MSQISEENASVLRKHTEDVLTALIKHIDDLGTTLFVATENGLFHAQNEIGFKECADPWNEARNQISQDVNVAMQKYMEALNKTNRAIKVTPLWWRFVFVYGLHLLVYLIAFFAFFVYLWFTYISLPGNTINLFWVPVWAPLLGALGAVVRGLWRLWFNVNKRQLRGIWLTYFLSLPFIGAIFGIMIYLAFLAGYIAATQSSKIVGEMLPMLLSLLAGFSWEWVVNTVNRILGIM